MAESGASGAGGEGGGEGGTGQETESPDSEEGEGGAASPQEDESSPFDEDRAKAEETDDQEREEESAASERDREQADTSETASVELVQQSKVADRRRARADKAGGAARIVGGSRRTGKSGRGGKGGSKGGGKKGGGGDPGSGKKSGGDGGAKFLGVSAKGKSFIYIVDCSGSMSGASLKKAKAKLRSSIGRLSSKRKFFVFFYSSSSYPMSDKTEMVEATKKNKRACYEWIKTINAGGGTQPTDALLQAIRMRPQVVFFMSDGFFPESVCDQVKQAQVSKPHVIIHAISFVSRPKKQVRKQMSKEQRKALEQHTKGAETVLKRLARENGGKYKRYRVTSP